MPFACHKLPQLPRTTTPVLFIAQRDCDPSSIGSKLLEGLLSFGAPFFASDGCLSKGVFFYVVDGFFAQPFSSATAVSYEYGCSPGSTRLRAG